jgi:hypothetical protein
MEIAMIAGTGIEKQNLRTTKGTKEHGDKPHCWDTKAWRHGEKRKNVG